MHCKIIFTANLCLMQDPSVTTWHHRIGHLPLYELQQMSLEHCNNNFFFVDNCSICHQARQHKKPFAHSSIHTTSIFKLIHIDI